jgi:hypothetical protein
MTGWLGPSAQEGMRRGGCGVRRFPPISRWNCEMDGARMFTGWSWMWGLVTLRVWAGLEWGIRQRAAVVPGVNPGLKRETWATRRPPISGYA